MKYRVKIRRGDGLDVKPEAEILDGNIFDFEEGWTIDDGQFKGEKAMLIKDLPDELRRITISWIESGDLELLKTQNDNI